MTGHFTPPGTSPTPSDQRGFVLPLVLLGLLAVTLMVTAMLVTSSTEAASGAAHQDAAAALFGAEGALQRYVGEHAADGLQPTGSSWLAYGDARIRVVRLAARTTPSGSERLFAVLAEEEEPSRTVGALVRQREYQPAPLQTSIGGALTAGGGLDLTTANSVRIRGDAPGCGPRGGVQAVVAAQGAAIQLDPATGNDLLAGKDENGGDTFGAAAIQDTPEGRLKLAYEALGLADGETIDDLIARIPASSKWGPRFRKPGEAPRSFDGVLDVGERVAVVDAAGGSVALRGGDGLLIVVGGDLTMGGNATFRGVAVVRGHFALGGSARFTGALIGVPPDDGIAGSVGDASGSVELRYDCNAVTAAESGFNQLLGSSTVTATPKTFGWWEVVR